MRQIKWTTSKKTLFRHIFAFSSRLDPLPPTQKKLRVPRVMTPSPSMISARAQRAIATITRAKKAITTILLVSRSMMNITINHF
jgi:hypothetical protein